MSEIYCFSRVISRFAGSADDSRLTAGSELAGIDCVKFTSSRDFRVVIERQRTVYGLWVISNDQCVISTCVYWVNPDICCS
ncbi:MAG TPA: hypothetical protein VHT91_04420 [Kofleriaceae bacterium]|nr:hypothetical protein [Kofleriaceae bacterium]